MVHWISAASQSWTNTAAGVSMLQSDNVVWNGFYHTVKNGVITAGCEEKTDLSSVTEPSAERTGRELIEYCIYLLLPYCVAVTVLFTSRYESEYFCVYWCDTKYHYWYFWRWFSIKMQIIGRQCFRVARRWGRCGCERHLNHGERTSHRNIFSRIFFFSF